MVAEASCTPRSQPSLVTVDLLEHVRKDAALKKKLPALGVLRLESSPRDLVPRSCKWGPTPKNRPRSKSSTGASPNGALFQGEAPRNLSRDPAGRRPKS
jgi:hypothetical protein